jgi:hypothetical protein
MFAPPTLEVMNTPDAVVGLGLRAKRRPSSWFEKGTG